MVSAKIDCSSGPLSTPFGELVTLLVGERAKVVGVGELGHERRVETQDVDRCVARGQPSKQLLALTARSIRQQLDRDVVRAVGIRGAPLPDGCLRGVVDVPVEGRRPSLVPPAGAQQSRSRARRLLLLPPRRDRHRLVLAALTRASHVVGRSHRALPRNTVASRPVRGSGSGPACPAMQGSRQCCPSIQRRKRFRSSDVLSPHHTRAARRLSRHVQWWAPEWGDQTHPW